MYSINVFFLCCFFPPLFNLSSFPPLCVLALLYFALITVCASSVICAFGVQWPCVLCRPLPDCLSFFTSLCLVQTFFFFYFVSLSSVWKWVEFHLHQSITRPRSETNNHSPTLGIMVNLREQFFQTQSLWTVGERRIICGGGGDTYTRRTFTLYTERWSVTTGDSTGSLWGKRKNILWHIFSFLMQDQYIPIFPFLPDLCHRRKRN